MTARSFLTKVGAGVMALCLFLADGSALAEDEWFTNFMDNTVVNQPTVWTTQQRGYMSMGGVSYRNPKSREPLISITAPRIQAGCGGIDAFWGGLSYLQPEYIIKAFEQIMSAAPGYAFKLALKTLCEQCDNAMTALEGLANAANSLAMDDCRAAQGLVNFGGDTVASTLDSLGVQGLAPDGNWMASKIKTATKTVTDWTNDLNNILDWQYCGGIANHDDAQKCKDSLMPQGSMWNKALKDEDDLLQNLIRGMFGDMLFSPPGDKNSGDGSDKPGRTAGIEYVEPCDNIDAHAYMQAFMTAGSDSNFMVRVRKYDSSGNTFGQCEDIPLPDGLKIGQRATTALEELISLMTNNPTGTVSAETVVMIGQSTFPIYQILNAYTYRARDVGVVIDDSEKQALAQLMAAGHIHYLLQKAVNRANVLLIKQVAKQADAGKSTGLNTEKLQSNVNRMQNLIATFKGELSREYSAAVKNYQDNMTALMNYENMKKQLMTVLRNKGMVAAYWGP